MRPHRRRAWRVYADDAHRVAVTHQSNGLEMAGVAVRSRQFGAMGMVMRRHRARNRGGARRGQ
jgi:hypothetical protein